MVRAIETLLTLPIASVTLALLSVQYISAPANPWEPTTSGDSATGEATKKAPTAIETSLTLPIAPVTPALLSVQDISTPANPQKPTTLGESATGKVTEKAQTATETLPTLPQGSVDPALLSVSELLLPLPKPAGLESAKTGEAIEKAQQFTDFTQRTRWLGLASRSRDLFVSHQEISCQLPCLNTGHQELAQANQSNESAQYQTLQDFWCQRSL